MSDINIDQIPTAEAMLQRLRDIDLDAFNLSERELKLKGNKAWMNAFAIPISALFITLSTLIGTFVFNSPFISFGISAALAYIAGKMLEDYEHKIKVKAYHETIEYIKTTEGEFGLIPHFKHFLPKRYRHLWQSLRKGRYQYVKQYAQAAALLQDKIEEEKFIKVWHLQYPHLAPPEPKEEGPFENEGATTT